MIRSKRWGVQATMAIGSCFLAGGQIAAAFATQMWHLFLTQGVCFALGLGFIMVSNQPIVAQWFGKKRALASGIVGGGSGVGGLIFSNLSRYLIEHKGLKWAFLVNGIASAAVMLPVTILMKRELQYQSTSYAGIGKTDNVTTIRTSARSKPLKARFEPFKVGLFRNPGFLSIVAWGCLLQFSYLVGLYVSWLDGRKAHFHAYLTLIYFADDTPICHRRLRFHANTRFYSTIASICRTDHRSTAVRSFTRPYWSIQWCLGRLNRSGLYMPIHLDVCS